jgi:hypothetical protein
VNVHSPRAQAVAEAISTDGFSGLRIEDELVSELRKLHPGFTPVTTIIVDSRTMDALYPPAVDHWTECSVDELHEWARRFLKNGTYDELRSQLADAFPALLGGEPSTTALDRAAKMGLDKSKLRRKVRQLRGRSTVALGCCLKLEDAAAVLRGVLDSSAFALLGDVVVALDHERIVATASKLGGVPLRQRSDWAKKTCLMKLVVPIWLHEQSHAVRRGTSSGDFEELSAQLDAYRVCSQADHFVFKEETGVPTIPSCSEMMRRLAKEQPRIYGAIFKGLR